MKNKMIMVILMVSAGVGQEAGAMAGAVKKVVLKNPRIVEMIVGGSLVGGSGVSFLSYEREKLTLKEEPPKDELSEKLKKIGKIIEEQNTLSPLAPAIEKEVKALFSKYGFFPEVDNRTNVTGVSVLPDQLAICERDRCILAHGRLDVCRGTMRMTLEKKHVMAILGGHEVDHVLHHDAAKKHEIAWEVESKNEEERKIIYAKHQREMEERSDRNAAYNLAGRDADSEILAQHTEEVAHYFSFNVPLEERELRGLKDEDIVKINRYRSHPLSSVWVKYLTELAAEFRAKKKLHTPPENLQKSEEKK